MFGRRTKAPGPACAPAAPAGAPAGERRPASDAALKRAILVALGEAIAAAGIGPLDPEAAREELRDMASDIIAGKSIVMSIAEQEDLLDDICKDVFS